MPNNMLQLRSSAPPRGSNRPTSDKMPAVSSRRVIPKNQDLHPSPGLPKGPSFNNQTGSSTSSSMGCLVSPTNGNFLHGMQANSDIPGNDIPTQETMGRFPQFDERRQDMLRPTQQFASSFRSPMRSSNHHDDNSNVDSKSCTPPDRSSSLTAVPMNFHSGSSPSSLSPPTSRKKQQNVSSSNLSNSPGSSGSMTQLRQKEEIVSANDPRVKFDPKLAIGSHHHVASSTSSDDRVQLRIAVEELRLIVKWREQQQQELQKRVGKLAGKYNKLLDLYISEKDRAETAFAKLQKQLRELRTKDEHMSNELSEIKTEKEQKDAEITLLREQLELEKRRYEADTSRMSSHVDSLTSKVRSMSKKQTDMQKSETNMDKYTDLAFCRWQQYGDGGSERPTYTELHHDAGPRMPDLPSRAPKRSVNSLRRKSSGVGGRGGSGSQSGGGTKYGGRSSNKSSGREKEEVGDEEDVHVRRSETRTSTTTTSEDDVESEAEDSVQVDDEQVDDESKGKEKEIHPHDSAVKSVADSSGVEVLATHKRRRPGAPEKFTTGANHVEHSTAATIVFQKKLDQAAVQIEILKCELQWRTKQVMDLQEKVNVKLSATSVPHKVS